MSASFGGGIVAIIMSYASVGKIEVLASINGVLGGLVGITASCAVVTVWEGIFIGAVGSFLANITDPLLVYLRVDDAVGATCVHGFGGAWGMIAVGIFAQRDQLEGYCKYDGILHGEFLQTDSLLAVCNSLSSSYQRRWRRIPSRNSGLWSHNICSRTKVFKNFLHRSRHNYTAEQKFLHKRRAS
jgi:ammonia channel protein AmtB